MLPVAPDAGTLARRAAAGGRGRLRAWGKLKVSSGGAEAEGPRTPTP
jgi:hypothetical protein